jgi:hypothetical protein
MHLPRLGAPHHFLHNEPKYYWAPFPENDPPRLTALPPNIDWASITVDFKELVKSCKLKVVSVAGTLSPCIVEADEAQLGELLPTTEWTVTTRATFVSLSKFTGPSDTRFEDMCKWLRFAFDDLLSSDPTWAPVLFPFDTKRPFEEADVNSTHFLGAQPDSKFLFGKGDIWLHLPANNEEWMKVGLTKLYAVFS